MGMEYSHFVPLKGDHFDGRNYTPSEPPNYGFKGQRAEREPPVSEEEIRAFKVPGRYRDYCAHKYMQYEICYEEKFPFTVRCAHERHAWQKCAFEDYVIRRKEYERERRLRERRKRLEAQSG